MPNSQARQANPDLLAVRLENLDHYCLCACPENHWSLSSQMSCKMLECAQAAGTESMPNWKSYTACTGAHSWLVCGTHGSWESKIDLHVVFKCFTGGWCSQNWSSYTTLRLSFGHSCNKSFLALNYVLNSFVSLFLSLSVYMFYILWWNFVDCKSKQTMFSSTPFVSFSWICSLSSLPWTAPGFCRNCLRQKYQLTYATWYILQLRSISVSQDHLSCQRLKCTVVFGTNPRLIAFFLPLG